jgi:hypothetical protein
MEPRPVVLEHQVKDFQVEMYIQDLALVCLQDQVVVVPVGLAALATLAVEAAVVPVLQLVLLDHLFFMAAAEVVLLDVCQLVLAVLAVAEVVDEAMVDQAQVLDLHYLAL